MTFFDYPHPQPIDGVVLFGEDISPEVSVDVYRKERWADEWILDNKLDCISVSWNAAPTIPAAVLRYRYGRVLEPGDSVETTRERLTSFNGWYIKIVVHCTDGDRVWHGFVDDQADEQSGIVRRWEIQPEPDPPLEVLEATGVQTFACVGMIAALDRTPINRIYFQVDDAFSNNETDIWRVAYSAPIFNAAPRGKKAKIDKFGNQQLPPTRTLLKLDVPNFSTDTTPPLENQRQSYLFTFPGMYGVSPTGFAGNWRLKDIIEYLCAYAAPRKTFYDAETLQNEIVPVWLFDPATLEDPLEDPIDVAWFQPIIDCDGLTLKGAFDRLLAPERGFGYTAWVDETHTPHRVYIEPYTINSEPTSVLIDGSLAWTSANNRIVENVATMTDPATAMSFQQNASTNYTAIAIRGAPEIVVTSLAVATDLSNGWSAALETEYDTEIAGLDLSILRELHQARDIRERGKYKPIGRNFVYKFDQQLLSPVSEPMFTVDDRKYLPFPLRLRMLDDLPLKEGVDYSESDIITLRIAHEKARATYRKAEAYGRSFEVDLTLTGPLQVWTHKSQREIIYDMHDPEYRLQVSELENEVAVGVQIDVQGSYQGALASGGGLIAPHVPKLDPDSLILTVAFQSDYEWMYVSYIAFTADIDANKVKVFDFGDRLQKITILQGTTVAIDTPTDTLVDVTENRVIRDDTRIAQQLAHCMTRYYESSRNILRLTSRRPTAVLWPGQLIKKTNVDTVLETIVGGCISEVAIQMPIGSDGRPGKPTFQVVTSRGELDPLAYLPTIY